MRPCDPDVFQLYTLLWIYQPCWPSRIWWISISCQASSLCQRHGLDFSYLTRSVSSAFWPSHPLKTSGGSFNPNFRIAVFSNSTMTRMLKLCGNLLRDFDCNSDYTIVHCLGWCSIITPVWEDISKIESVLCLFREKKESPMETERFLRSVNSHLRLSDYECSKTFQPSLRWALHFIPTHLTSPKEIVGRQSVIHPPSNSHQ